MRGLDRRTLLRRHAMIDRVTSGSIRKRVESQGWFTFALVGLILLCTALLVFAPLGAFGTFLASAVLAIAGAYLGNEIRTDLSADLVRNQARPATRELFDHSERLSAIVQRAEAHQQSIEDARQLGHQLDPGRVADWFGTIGFSLRHEISSTASAIENWGDLAKDVLEDERASYITRQLAAGRAQGDEEE